MTTTIIHHGKPASESLDAPPLPRFAAVGALVSVTTRRVGAEGEGVGLAVVGAVGTAVGLIEGFGLRWAVGPPVGAAVGPSVGAPVGALEGCTVGI